MAISIQNHTELIAKTIVGTFKENIPVRSGFDGFFARETVSTEMVDVQVQRDTDLVAVDVMRFAEGNYNKRSKVTENKYIPPFFKEIYSFRRDEMYMSTIAQGIFGNDPANQAVMQKALDNLNANRKKIERAIRKQQAEVLQTGIVELKNGDSIDYRRKAASMVDLGSGDYWNQTGKSPEETLKDAFRFLRDEGNSGASTANVIMRGDAMSALLNNAKVQSLLDNRRMERGNIVAPQFNEASGMAFHGQLSAGDFVVNLWTYNEKYTDANGATKHYLDRENVVVLPEDFQGKTVFGGLPAMRDINIQGQMTRVPQIVASDYLIRAWYDERNIDSLLELTSAPLVIPFTVDKVYTMKVLA